jgi:hypothetical protein
MTNSRESRLREASNFADRFAKVVAAAQASPVKMWAEEHKDRKGFHEMSLRRGGFSLRFLCLAID